MKKNTPAESIQTNEKTSIETAASAIEITLSLLEEAFGKMMPTGESTDDFCLKIYFSSFWNDEKSDPEKVERDFLNNCKKKATEVAELGLLYTLQVVMAFAVQSLKEQANSNRAWSFACSALYWAGVAQTSLFGQRNGTNAASQMATLRHAENYALTADALKYWKANIDPHLSAQKAANLLLSVVPLSHKKLAEIVSQAKKGRINPI